MIKWPNQWLKKNSELKQLNNQYSHHIVDWIRNFYKRMANEQKASSQIHILFNINYFECLKI